MGYTDDLMRELERRNLTGKIYSTGGSSSSSSSGASNKKKKKDEYTEELLEILSQRANQSGNTLNTSNYGIIDLDTFKAKKDDDDDIAPVKKAEQEDDSLLDFFQKGALGDIDLRKNFRDGYQFGDVLKTGGHVAGQVGKTILGTAGDLGLGVARGFGSTAEGVADEISYLIANGLEARGNEAAANQWRKNAKENTVQEWTSGADEYLNRYSVAGRTVDSAAQGLGQVLALIGVGGGAKAVGVGVKAAGALVNGLLGLSTAGNATSEAYQGGATDEEATTYGVLSGAGTVITSMLFGGLGKAVNATGFSTGLSQADDMLAKKVSGLFTNQIAKNFAEYGIKMGAEGFEEILEGFLQSIAKKATYMKEEEWVGILKDENLLEQFVVGGLVSGMMQSGYIPGTKEGSLRQANKTDRDFITGFTQNEQSVIDKEIEKRVAAQEEKSGKKLTRKEIGKIETAVLEDVDRGGISIDTIEEVLGGETYTNFKKLADYETAMQTEYDELGKKEHYTLADETRYKQLEERMKFVKENGAKNEMRKRLDDQMSELMKDSRLAESYNERARRGQKFEADLTQYDEKQKAIVQKAVDSGILNNTRRTHDFVDLVARIGAEKGVDFDFANNEKLTESGFVVEGRIVNGVKRADGGITVNIQSAKALDTVVGHEITHVLEGTELYGELQKAAIEYAKAKGDYQGRYDALVKMYEKGTDIDAELTADIVGEYLFTDSDFIANLSANHRNVFQKIYDEVKYLLNVATAGSKEARQLEKVKKAFEKAYREGGESADGGVKYSVYSRPNFNSGEWAIVNRRKHSEFANPKFDLDTDKKWMYATEKGHTVFAIYSKHDAEDPTILYGSSGKKAERDYAKLNRFFEEGQRYAGNSRATFDRLLNDIKGSKGNASDGIPHVGARGTATGDVFLPFGESYSDGRRDSENGAENLQEALTEYDDEASDDSGASFVTFGNDYATIRNFMKDGDTPEEAKSGAEVKYSLVEDQGTIDFLENQEHLTVYKAMSLIDGKLYPPMASQTYVEEEYTTKKGEKKTRRVRKLKNPSVLGRWQQADERTDIAEKTYDPKKGYSSFDLLKSNGKTTGGVAYNPYEHTSNIVLNDQFSEAYQRPELVTVEYEIPVSELTSGYKAQYAKDPVGLTDWKAGGVAQKLKHGHRDVYLTRWSKPVRILSDAEVAQKYKEILDKEEGISVPWNVVTPSLREELEKIGVPIDYSDIKAGSTVRSFEAAVRGDYEKPKKGAKYSLSSDSEGRQLAPGVAKRFANSKVVDENGDLRVVYHGTTYGEFSVFSKEHGNVENDFGVGFYFSSSDSDVSEHYDGGGPDFENKVARRAEQIEAEEDIDYEEAEQRAREELFRGGHKFEVYLNIENPAIVGETMLFSQDEALEEYDEADYDDYDDYIADVEQAVADKIESIVWDVERKTSAYSVDGLSYVLFEAYSEGGIGIEELKTKVNDLYLEDENGNLIGNEVVRQIIESLGYDGIVDPTVSGKWNMDMEEGTTHYIAFRPEQIKAVTNENPTDNPDIRYSLSEIESAYQTDIENGDMIGAELAVERAANLAMPDSKIRDEDGNLIPVYHGTREMFYEFDTSIKGGVNGTAEGFGIYTSDDPEVTEAYGNRQIKMYANITKPATSDKKTISPAKLAALIKDTCKKQAQKAVEDGEYDSVQDALMDTWVSNYVYTYGIGMERAYRDVAKSILEMNDSDMAVIQEVMVGMAIRDYAEATDFYRNSLIPITGFDGFVTHWENSATGKKSNIYLAFDSSQLKSADTVTYDDNGNVIPLSERFNPKKKDIRNSLSPEGAQPASDGNYGRYHVYGRDIALETAEDIAPVAAPAADIAPVRTDAAVYEEPLEEESPYAEVDRLTEKLEEDIAPVRADVAAESETTDEAIMDKDSFFSKRAAELYDEIRNLKKGVKASPALGHLLDHGYEWRTIKTALLNIRDWPSQRVDFNSAAESVAREMIYSEYEDYAYEMSEAQESAPAAKQPIKNVKERLAAKLQNLQTELANNQRLREESRTDYDLEIQQAQTAYYALQNKNTKKANDILRRIERLRRISGNIDADYAKRISDLEAEVGKVREEVRSGESTKEQAAMRQELHARKIEEMRFEFAERGFDFDEVLKNAKDLSTLATVDNTPQRVMEKALGYKEGQALADLTVNKVAQNETEGIKWLHSYTDRKNGLLAQISKQYGIKPGSKESAAAQMYAEGFYVADNEDIIAYGDRELAQDFPDAKVQENIKGLARDPRIRQIYDATLAMINESRARNAYPEIQKLENYFLHFRAMDDTFSRLGIPFNPNDIKAKDLPTDLNGVTADLKPGQPYFASAMHRKGKRTSFDLLGGLERYLTSAKGQIYHIDDIQTLRALRNHIADTYGQAHGLENLDAMTEEEAAAQIEQVYDAHLSTFAKFLNEEANVIAGKTALIDRGLEGIIGRRGMTFFDTLNRQVGANMVGFNVSSSLTNFIAPVQAFAKTNKAAFVKGFAQTVANRIGSIAGKGDGFAESNPTMIRRQGADRFYRTPWQKAGDIGYALMGAVDSISTEIIVRSKVNEYVQKGMDAEQAVIEADKWASRLMGDRSLGQMPQLYNSKMLGLITKFQLEVRNQLDSQFYDTIQEAKVSAEDIQNKHARNAKIAAQVTSTFVTLAVAQHLFGKAFEAVAGYNPAFDIIEAIIKAFGWDDEEESEDTALDNLGQGFMSLLEDMPYSSVITDGGRIPVSAALPISQLIKGEDKYGNEKSRLETVAETAPYWVLPGGYGQIKKTVQGLGMFNTDMELTGSYTDSGKLRFTVEDTFENRVQAAVFGQWANENARAYFDEERTPLAPSRIDELNKVGFSMEEYWDYLDGLKDQEELSDKFDYIAGLDLPIDKKNILINNVVDRKEAVDLTNYDDFANYEEFDFAVKNPEKYDFLQSVGVSVAEYQSFDDDTKDAYNWAYENPDKYTLSRAVSDDVAVYRQYTKALNDIKADKYADGRTVNGSRKTKVVDYLNNLDADYYTKIILFKMEYNADDTYNREIIEYLNGRADISYEEEVTILKELGFTVLPDGTVRW